MKRKIKTKKLSKDSITLFLVSLISFSGIVAILVFSPNITGQINLIESIMQLGQKKVNELRSKQISESYKIPVDIKNSDVLTDDLQEENLDFLIDKTISEKPLPSSDYSVVGSWRPHQQGIFYDAGASNFIQRPVTRKLTIYEDGFWEFGSTGTWEVKPITQEDWERWEISPYAASKKIILYGWNDAIGDGPIDEGTEGVDFIWIIYRSEKLTLGPATIQMKFGH